MGSKSLTVARQINGALSTLGDTKLEAEHLLEIVLNLTAVCEDGSRGVLRAMYVHASSCEAQAEEDAAVELAAAWLRIADRINDAVEHDGDDWITVGAEQ